MPNETDRARLIQKFCAAGKKNAVTPIDQKLRQRAASVRSTTSVYFVKFNYEFFNNIFFRSGYAFSQEKGFGSMITSGTLRTKSAEKIHSSQH